MKRRNDCRGFTIVELVIVIAVIGILATVLVPAFGDVINNAKNSAAKQDAKNAYTQYLAENAGKGEMPELFLYAAEEGRVVALLNGATVGVYESEDAALTDLIGEDYDDSKLQEIVNDKFYAYGGDVPASGEPAGPQKESITGKKISFMGDSISTFEGWNNNADYNTTLADNRVMYDKKGESIYHNLLSVNETWWMRTVNKLGLELCVNNSFSGSRVTSGCSSYPNETGCGDRAINLHNDNTGEMPDIIVIFMGTNDYQQIGGAVSVDAFAKDYAVMIKKIKDKYPDADLYLCTLPNYDHITAKKPTEPAAYNERIKAIATEYGCNVVDFYNDTGITPDNIKYYTVDLLIDGGDISLVHPNASGMGKMYECIKAAIAKNYAIQEKENESYTVTVESDPAIAVGDYSQTVTEGDAFDVTINGYAMSVTVTMGGHKIDCFDSAHGKIIIPYVTGDVAIEVTPAEWEWLQFLNQLPDELDGTTNLYKQDGLKSRIGYYTANNTWNPDRTDVVSAIFAVSQGMQIQSSSFVHTDGTYKGTIITWFMQDGTMQTVKQEYVYEQQTTVGYVTVPKGVIAVSMVWRTTCTEEACKNNYMYIMVPDQN